MDKSELINKNFAGLTTLQPLWIRQTNIAARKGRHPQNMVKRGTSRTILWTAKTTTPTGRLTEPIIIVNTANTPKNTGAKPN